ncbi:DUF397 domain-containing protein [Streptomyces fradiae]|uniref:DUF397 domain-containing protein n=1 Tax=Streptomyces fradiae TaxID=1906 RepID=UPI0036694782
MTNDLRWFKSSYSGDQGGDCVEVAFVKSSYSGPQGGDCVEVAACAHAVRVRDSKDTARPGLAVAPEAWSVFVRAVG